MLLLLVFSSIEIRTSESLLHEKLFGLNTSFRNFRSWSDFRYYNNSISPWTAALNIYLYGEANQEWLKYIDTNGRISVSRIKSPYNIPKESYFNAASQTKIHLYTHKPPRSRQIICRSFSSWLNELR